MPQELNQLIQKCIKGDRHSQGKLYARYAPAMFVLCQRYARNREEAEEIMQEGFMKMFDGPCLNFISFPPTLNSTISSKSNCR